MMIIAGTSCGPRQAWISKDRALSFCSLTESFTKSQVSCLLRALHHYYFFSEAITHNGVKLSAQRELKILTLPFPWVLICACQPSSKSGGIWALGQRTERKVKYFKALFWISILCFVFLLLKMFSYSPTLIYVIILCGCHRFSSWDYWDKKSDNLPKATWHIN